jgi:hypothetical protein
MYAGTGDFDGRHAAEEIEDVGAMDGTAVQEAVCSETGAGTDFAGVGAAVCDDGNRPAFLRDEPFVIFSEELVGSVSQDAARVPDPMQCSLSSCRR